MEIGAMASACTVAALAEASHRINYQASKQTTPVYTPCHPGQQGGPSGVCDPGSSVQGWQSLFATETGGLFQTGNSVASAGQTSAALKLSAVFSTFPWSFQKTGSRVKLFHPNGSLPIRRGPRLARDDTVCSLVSFVSG